MPLAFVEGHVKFPTVGSFVIKVVNLSFSASVSLDNNPFATSTTRVPPSLTSKLSFSAIGKSFTGDDLDIKIYYHKRKHNYSTSDLRKKINQFT